MTPHQPFDFEAYVQQITTSPCFICELIGGNPAYRHHMIYEDETAVVFLNKYPVLYGYTLVAPRRHREHVTGDFTLAEYMQLQQIIYSVAEAMRKAVPTERVYILSLGSQQGNRHVHWHIAALPPGVPFKQQQLEALSFKRGVLALPDEELAAVAGRIRAHLELPP
jgi:diadenosine tetraphosphate (Ap4A) HIT family hydrolase